MLIDVVIFRKYCKPRLSFLSSDETFVVEQSECFSKKTTHCKIMHKEKAIFGHKMFTLEISLQNHQSRIEVFILLLIAHKTLSHCT